MKMRHGLMLAAALAMSGTAFAHGYGKSAAYDGSYMPASDRYVVGVNSVHSGGMTADDQALADRIASAIAGDRKLSEPGITATIVANNGRVSLNGSAKDVTQAARAEQIACDIAGRANVSGTLDSQPG
jgi:osmotically-inducible protein OsmY